MEILNVLRVPDLKINIFSQGHALDRRLFMMPNANSTTFSNEKSDKAYAVAKRKNKLYQMVFRIDKIKLISQLTFIY